MIDRKEYIERERISGVLPPTCPYDDEYSDGYNTCLETVKGLIREAPAADVVEVVRCKDCSWFIAREEGAGDCDMILGFTGPVSENGYCYCGKRKDGADNAAD